VGAGCGGGATGGGGAGCGRLEPPPCSTPSPPPLPELQGEDALILASSEPLPPPPPLLLHHLHHHQPDSDQQQLYHHQHLRQQQQEPQQHRRLITPVPVQQASPVSANGDLSSPAAVGNGSRNGRQPAATPKRDSPATIAAKEAPGWQMFLGFKSSTVSFTSEEVDRLRAARDESRTRVGRREESRTRAAAAAAHLQQQQLFPKPAAPPPQQQQLPGPAAAVRNDQLRREESFAAAAGRLKRTESRGRKRTENPNSGCGGPGEDDGPGGGCGEDGGQENADPNNWSGVKKRQQLGGIVQQRSQQLLGRSTAHQQKPTPQPRISGGYNG
jgi:hypothetical protein